jgi:hypothetical protein
MVSVERFVVQDALKVGGTLDRAAELLVPMTPTDGRGPDRGGARPARSSSTTSRPRRTCRSPAASSGAELLLRRGHPVQHRDRVSARNGGTLLPSLEWALITARSVGQGKAALYWVNLTTAREAAEEACTVYEWRNRRGKSLITKAVVVDAPPEDFVAVARTAESVSELSAAHERALVAGAWTDELRQTFTECKLALLAKAS